jgi:hypothetical protein
MPKSLLEHITVPPILSETFFTRWYDSEFPDPVFHPPQFHVIYDKLTTVSSDHSYDLRETWIDLFRNSRESYLEEHDVVHDRPLLELHNDWLTDEERVPRQTQSDHCDHTQQQNQLALPNLDSPAPEPPPGELLNEALNQGEPALAPDGFHVEQGELPTHQGELPADQGEPPVNTNQGKDPDGRHRNPHRAARENPH